MKTNEGAQRRPCCPLRALAGSGNLIEAGERQLGLPGRRKLSKDDISLDTNVTGPERLACYTLYVVLDVLAGPLHVHSS